ncbi:MAG: metalloregulator ArsR/SmtB family transcription factor [Halothiobacillaceae bacterium]|nr:MAG: metalloregulator ArsR/SmtB family transcription factor [Halothiobacillaceae bacterium]
MPGFKQDLNDQFARLGKVLSNGRRLELLEYLAQGERGVEQLANVSGLSVANTSQHLQQMRQAGLVNARREGKQILYSLAGDDVVHLLDVLRTVAERRLAEVREMVANVLTARDSLEPIQADELLERSRLGLVTVLDVRPPEEFEAGHLPDAINITLAELEKHLDRLPADKEVVAYCRGPYCVLSFEAVARLRERGFQARRLEQGYPEWKLAGLPTEAGSP